MKETEGPLVKFRESVDAYVTEKATYPNEARIDFGLYDQLLKVDYFVDKKPKLIGALFGIKILVDPMLRDGEIELRP